MARMRRYFTWDEALAEWRRFGLPETFIDRKRMSGTITVIEDDITKEEAESLVSSVRSMGGEAHICRKARSPKVLINAQPSFFERMSLSAEQSRHVSKITDAIRNTNAEHAPSVPYGRRELRFERPLVMGILNVTPDSFSDGGECLTKEAAVRRFQEMVSEGADIIDIGAESTRPGAVPISEDEELSRLLPVLREVVGSKVPVSVDTRHASVAEEAVRAGASIVNDISGLKDPEMTEVVARSGCPVVAMHMRGDPQNMQSLTVYEDLLGDIHTELSRVLQRAEAGGIQREKVILDPGIGFAKTTEQNLEIIRRLGELRSLGRPLLIGASRKRFIGEISGGGPKERLAGSIAAAVMAVTNGANIVRVHDVAPTVQALKVAHAVISPTARPY